MKIRMTIEQLPNGQWEAIDDDRYEADGDSEGYIPNHAQGTGATPYEAARDLIDNLEEHFE